MKDQKITSPRVMRILFLLIMLVILTLSFRLVFSADQSLNANTLQEALYPIEMGLLIGALVTLCIAQVMYDREERTKEPPVWFFPLIAGALGFFCMFTAYTHFGMYPAGTYSGMTVDMHHQYAPLLAKLRDMYINGGSLLYSFEVGLGGSFLPLFAYYLASPLNFLLVLFPETMLTEGILFITLIKNALCAAFFALMAQQLFGKRDFRVCVVSLMYSLMMYLLAYSWNIMWLDAVMVLPLVILGFERLQRTGRYPLYVLSLAYVLFSNYYIGFMVCVFLVLYYLVWVIRQKRTLREVGYGTARFGIGSLLGGGMAMCLLIPVYLSLAATSAAGGELPKEWVTNFPIADTLEQLLYGAIPTIRSGNLPNLFCGTLSLLLLPVYFTTPAISLRRRLTMGGLLAVMTLSETLQIPDLLWHGLHAPNDLPYRFSFLVSFVLLLIAYETLVHIKDVSPKKLGLSAASVALAAIVLEKLNAVEKLTEAKNAGNMPMVSVYVTLLLVAVYAGVLLLAKYKVVRYRLATSVLLLVVVVEMTFGAQSTLKTLNKNEVFTSHSGYVDNLETDAIWLAVERAEKIAEKDTAGGFYRLEHLPRRTCVDTALFGYRGLTTFASSNRYETTRLMHSLGYAANGVNSYLYNSFVAPTDSLLGIRYVILENKVEGHSQLKYRDSVTASRPAKSGATPQKKTLYIYENTDALSAAYVVNNQIRDFEYNYYKPFDTQNDLFAAMTGNWDDMYTFCKLSSDNSSKGYTAGTCNFTHSGDGVSSYTATVTQVGQYFLFADCRAAKTIEVNSGNNTWNVPAGEPYIIDAGVLSEGDEVNFTITADNTVSGSLYVARLDTALFERYMEELKQSSMTVTEFTDTRLAGTVTASKISTVMTSLVYDEGWTVKVDGKQVDTVAIGDGLLGFDVSAGEHTVEITFFPRGLTVGLLLSAGALLAFIALVVLRYRADRRDATVSEGTETEAAE